MPPFGFAFEPDELAALSHAGAPQDVLARVEVPPNRPSPVLGC